MEGNKSSSSSSVASVAREGAELRNVATTRTGTGEDQKEEANRAVVTAAGQGLAAVVGVKRKRDVVAAVDGDGSGSTSGGGEQSSQLHPMRTLVEQPALKPLQELVNACRAGFNGTNFPPTSNDVCSILGIMDKMGMFDAGLMDEIGFFLHRNMGPQNPPVVTSKTIYICASNFMVSVLYLPAGGVMPLHDHTGTTVFTKLLAGSARIQAYDWVHPRVSSADPGSVMLVEKVRDEHLKARSARPWVLFPNSSGNLNCFVAGQDGPCAFLKVFTPLYSIAQQQGCSFYQCLPYKFDLNVGPNEVSEEKKRRLAWVRKIPQLKDVIKIVNLPYRGLPIV